jgi:hypothetical protein
MRLLVAAIAVLVLGVLALSSFGAGRSEKVMQGELRCEGDGGVISMLTARTMRSTARRVRAILQLRAFGTTPLVQKPT